MFWACYAKAHVNYELNRTIFLDWSLFRSIPYSERRSAVFPGVTFLTGNCRWLTSQPNRTRSGLSNSQRTGVRGRHRRLSRAPAGPGGLSSLRCQGAESSRQRNLSAGGFQSLRARSLPEMLTPPWPLGGQPPHLPFPPHYRFSPTRDPARKHPPLTASLHTNSLWAFIPRCPTPTSVGSLYLPPRPKRGNEESAALAFPSGSAQITWHAHAASTERGFLPAGLSAWSLREPKLLSLPQCLSREEGGDLRMVPQKERPRKNCQRKAVCPSLLKPQTGNPKQHTTTTFQVKVTSCSDGLFARTV